MLAVGVIVIWARNVEVCPPPMYAMCDDPRRPHHQPFPWSKGADGGWEVRIPISKENIDIAANYHRDPGYKVRCEFDALVDPFHIPEAIPPKDPDMVPADPDWVPEAEEAEVTAEAAPAKRSYTRRK